MPDPQPNNPLHGITLEQVVTRLEKRYGWEYLARNININCFKSNPSVKSSLKFLRRTPWARDKVEALYIAAFANQPAAGDQATPKPTGPWANSLAKIARKDS
ncbi:MAG: VF530 family protein [Porticoccaceae bacterium]|nr:VF530 family protein [Porticoccaceae bacterium]